MGIPAQGIVQTNNATMFAARKLSQVASPRRVRNSQQTSIRSSLTGPQINFAKNMQHVSTIYDKPRDDEPINSITKPPRENIDPIDMQILQMEKMRENCNKNIT